MTGIGNPYATFARYSADLCLFVMVAECNGPLEPRYGILTAIAFWRRDNVMKSGTVQSRPTSRSRLSMNPVVCRSAIPNSTFIERQVCMAASL